MCGVFLAAFWQSLLCRVRVSVARSRNRGTVRLQHSKNGCMVDELSCSLLTLVVPIHLYFGSKNM